MNDNLIYFPIRKRAPKRSLHHDVCDSDLVALREAFDRARESWPVEVAELPENNKIYSHYKK